MDRQEQGRLLSRQVAVHARLGQHLEAERTIASLPTDDTDAKKRAIAFAARIDDELRKETALA